MFSRIFRALAFLSVLFILPAYAETAEEALARCARLETEAERLRCYDEAAALFSAPKTGEGAGSDVVLQGEEKNVIEVEPIVLPISATKAEIEVPEPEAVSRSLLARAWDLDRKDADDNFTIRPYLANYLLPVVHQFRRNVAPSSPTQSPSLLYGGDMKKTEAHFQISLKTRVWNDVLGTPLDLWLGYTQKSYWQVYNSEWSSPFRESDYEPEVMATLPVHANLFGVRLRMLGAGFVHQSNGQSDPLSRSWNRAYLMAGLERGDWTAMLRGWYRIKGRTSSDDNPDINKYMGYGDLWLHYQLGEYSLAATGRLNAATGYGAAQLDFTFPISGYLQGYVRYFDGYGENLLDYNYHNRSIGVGVVFGDWRRR